MTVWIKYYFNCWCPGTTKPCTLHIVSLFSRYTLQISWSYNLTWKGLRIHFQLRECVISQFPVIRLDNFDYLMCLKYLQTVKHFFFNSLFCLLDMSVSCFIPICCLFGAIILRLKNSMQTSVSKYWYTMYGFLFWPL